MSANADRFAAVEHELARLRAEVADLRAEAFIIRTIEEMWAGASAPCPAPQRTARHLSVVGDPR